MRGERVAARVEGLLKELLDLSGRVVKVGQFKLRHYLPSSNRMAER